MIFPNNKIDAYVSAWFTHPYVRRARTFKCVYVLTHIQVSHQRTCRCVNYALATAFYTRNRTEAKKTETKSKVINLIAEIE